MWLLAPINYALAFVAVYTPRHVQHVRQDSSVRGPAAIMLYGGGYDDDGYGGGGYGGGGGGGGGRGYRSDMYERDPTDTAAVDVDRVEQLLAERSDLRRSRDFDGADAIRDELKGSYGVTVIDREMLWFVGGGGGGGRRGYGRGGGGYDRGAYDRGGGGYDRGGYDRGGYDRGGYDRGGYDRAAQDFGPDGHDYVFASEDSSEVWRP